MCDWVAAGFSCVSCKMNARMSGQSLKEMKKRVRRDEEV